MPRASIPLYLAAVLGQGAALYGLCVPFFGVPFASVLILFLLLGAVVSHQWRRAPNAGQALFPGAIFVAGFFVFVQFTGGRFGRLLPLEISLTGNDLALFLGLSLTAVVASFFWLTDIAVLFSCVWSIAMMGVAASTTVKGPIAVVLTGVFYLLSGEKNHEFMEKLVTSNLKNRLQGGGALESMYRLVMQLGPVTELPDSPTFNIVKRVDAGSTSFLWLCKQIIPQTKSFNMSTFVANGFDVPFDVSVFPSFLVVAAFFLPCVMLGYFSLRSRELESK